MRINLVHTTHLISVLVLLGLSMPPKVLCECGCGLFVSVHTVRRHLEGKARPHIRSTGRWDPVSVVHTPSIHSQNSAPSETCIVTHPEPVLVPQDAHDISESMDWSAADSPVRSMSCEPGSPELLKFPIPFVLLNTDTSSIPYIITDTAYSMFYLLFRTSVFVCTEVLR